MSRLTDDEQRDLVTVRDWLRYAVTRFTQANLAYGHGTSNAIDEAAFVILEALRLPVDDIGPWLEARLLGHERERIGALIQARISTRKPAAHLLNAAYIQGRRFYVDERVIVPRSYIGELMASTGLAEVIEDRTAITRVLDLCTGSACLAVLAAEAFEGAVVDAVDISPAALEVAAINVRDHGLVPRIRLIESDLFAQVGDRRYDLIIANPPYVADAEMAVFPPEHRAEPALAHAGGVDGLDLVRRILREAGHHLTERGLLVMEIGTGRALLEPGLGTLEVMWLDTETSEGEVLAVGAQALRQGVDARAHDRRRSR